MLTSSMVISLFEWKSAWGRRGASSDAVEHPGAHSHPGILPWNDEHASEEEAPEFPDEEQRKDIRQQVAHAWFGMAGFLPGGPMQKFDSLLWRWLTPRERFLSCLGSEQAAAWFPRTWKAATLLAVMVTLALLMPWLEERLPTGDPAFWMLSTFVALTVFVVHSGWPGRDSGFQPWLEQMHTADLGHFPAFAVLPVTAGEWMRAAMKEWTLRSAWFALLWTIAILCGAKGLSPEVSSSWLMAYASVPWLVLATWFPLSMVHRMISAVSGAAFRSHGITRVLPALVAGLMSLIAGGATVFAIGKEMPLVAFTTIAVAALSGTFSLWQTRRRCSGMRLDIKPRMPA
ncbi:hypothetical protein OKA04_02175 [Luteolibacter flavescens]|uniref:Uncharacterized protein n=1 Tax=Luteolibacter flavescens TaxID=1859460 RepID=A0ABT3FIX6_9BACT|nr:hypothetical protein [Luteolibacter flavescens]MCW1883516.1 hypothetical protein [Luteolibacter flavescens]